MFVEKIDGSGGENNQQMNSDKTAKSLQEVLQQIKEMQLQEARKRSETAKARTAQIKARLQMILNNSKPQVGEHLQKAIERCDKILEAEHHEHIAESEFEMHLDNLHGHVAKAESAHKESEVSNNETEKKRTKRMARTRNNITNQQRRRDYRDKIEHEEENHHVER